ncbi:AAA family ATPase [Acetivibrio ethanolgignens]|uniref:Nuclease SbcCD subunit C n=1 Tax=Acetivibrio ethanolgignens TaxID=290052 RepID=A0A0V8QEW8_9FIRM|nr:SMC family ATPase [Acetivibrio ethanolgignens]KSV59095.1 hypothetical protein ASU35_01915 [Acetivibrio ethanolgignens]
MRPIHMILSGFGPYPGREEVNFSKLGGNGVFLITGPTGSGKTTIFDGITYALFGAASTQVRDKSSLRSDFAEEDTETYVELLFWHKGKEYTIRRSPKYERRKKRGSGVTLSNESALLLEEDKRPLETVTEVNNRIEEILGFNYKQFKQLGMLAQGEFMELLLASSRDRVEIFRDLFQTKAYEELQRRLSEEAKGLKDRLTDLSSRMAELLGQAGFEKTEGLLPAELAHQVKEDWEKEKLRKREVEEELKRTRKSLKELEEKGAEYFKLEKELFREIEKNKKKKKDWEEQAVKAASLETALTELLEKNKLQREKEKRELKELLEEKKESQKKQKELLGWERQLLEIEGAIKEKKREEEGLLFLLKEFSELAKEQKKQESLKQSYEIQLKKEKEVRARYQEKEELYRSTAIGLAARFLEEGKPCPVCGSLSHPNKAKVSKEVPDQQEVDHWKELAQKERVRLDEVFAATQENLGALKKRKADTKAACEKEGILDEAEGKEKYCLLQQEEKELCLRLKNCKSKEKEAKGLEKLLLSLEKREETLKRQEEKGRLREEGETEKLRERLSKESLKAAEKRTIFEEGVRVEETLKEKLEATAKRLSLDISFVEVERKSLECQIKELEQKRDFSVARLGKLKTAWETLKLRLAERQELEEKYGIWQNLDNITKGKNKDRLVFEQYVLAVYFEEVLESANLRLAEMTSGRYELRKVRRVEDARTTNSLDIEIFDNYTGKCRPVKSLSGGESFKAALCLALGMADMIEASIGGIRIDTLFIDEGFGSLDEESLDQALKSLLSLTGQKHLIGIISHINELKERIDQQIVIEKGRSGSHIVKK